MIKEFTIQLFSNLLYQTTPSKILAEISATPPKEGNFYDADKISTIFVILKGSKPSFKKYGEMLPA